MKSLCCRRGFEPAEELDFIRETMGCVGGFDAQMIGFALHKDGYIGEP